MTNEHLPDLQLLQVHLINIGMKCSAAEVLYRTILGSLPTVWQFQYIPDCNDGEFFTSHVSLLNNHCQASSHIIQM